ncbi:MAG: HAMP domain-containing protein [Deltaproteobacteria bacterium]|nr:HAMP domain-containing protein [Deltaproteobacteria bacterium]
MSLRWKLTLWYAASVTLIMTAFVGADVIGLSRNLQEHEPSADMSTSLREALWEHGWLALITIFVVALVGHFVIGRALHPVQEMVSLARTITAEDLSRRIQIRSRNEIGELGETLNGMIARLERSFQHMDHFATIVAHELNTPLATLKGELELMKRRDRSSEEYRAMIPRLQSQVDRLSGLVDNLLLLSRMESQRSAFELGPVQLDQIVLETYEEYEGLAREAGVSLTVDVPERATVTGERALAKQLVSNLVANGIRYTDQGGSVAVTLIAADAGLELRVADTGRGIPADALPHVFEPFYRADALREAATSGVGLGLAIVRRVGDLHGCTLRVESTVGKGTTVCVGWPPASADRQGPSPDATASS